MHSYLDVDFSHIKHSQIICYISGHAHTDLIAEPGWYYEGSRIVKEGVYEPCSYHNMMPCHVVSIGHNFYNSNTNQSVSRMGGVNYARRKNTASQDLWDTMVYDPTSQTIHFIRFGAGEDRFFSVENSSN